MSRNEQLNNIKKLIKMLDSIDYKAYSEGKVNTYLEYIEGERSDEDDLIEPLFRKFLFEILCYEIGKSIKPQHRKGEGKPDFLPIDITTHPFVFDTKSTAVRDLSSERKQIEKYVKDYGLKYGILSNLRDIDVYIDSATEELEEYNFNFRDLYKDYKENANNVLDKENTKRFLGFVDFFQYKELNYDQKIQHIIDSQPWPLKHDLDIETLTSRIRYIVECLHEDVRLNKEEIIPILSDDIDQQIKISRELDIIAGELERTKSGREISKDTLKELIKAESKSLDGRAIDVYFYRVAYFTMTRILLARIWEDLGFIEQTLFDGGFEKWYKIKNKQITGVIDEAILISSKKYSWLYNVRNNYNCWYSPSNEVLVEILYELSNFPLGKLNADILGTIYEDYIDRADRKNKGQYYTPREIVRFIWDRVGFIDDKAYFRIEGNKRMPKLIFDPASGSGGFLVEAARRIREEAHYDENNFQDLLEVRNAIFAGLYGSEISPFPHYITEVNLLIQVTPILKKLHELKKAYKEWFTTLGVLPCDSLGLFVPKQKRMFEINNKYLPEKEKLILPLDNAKINIFEKIKYEFNGKFDFCCSNPPYIGEKMHKELFRYSLAKFPGWEEFYQRKMDYLYFFIILGLSKLKNTGKLGFITTGYWHTADGAEELRKYILNEAKICEIIDFDEVKIFEKAKGQHNMIFVLEKCTDSDKRSNNIIRIVKVKKPHKGKNVEDKLRNLIKHIEAHIDKVRVLHDKYDDEFISIFISPIKQGELTNKAWNIMFMADEKAVLDKIKYYGIPLANICDINMGVQTAADLVTENLVEMAFKKGLCSSEYLKNNNINYGDGIYVLNENEINQIEMNKNEKSLIKPFYKNSDIDPYYYAQNEKKYLIYVDSQTDINQYPNIKKHLLRFRPLLAAREQVKNEESNWFWIRGAKREFLSKGEAIVNPYRAKRNIFCLSNGNIYGAGDLYFTTPTSETKEGLKYILAILNSNMARFWLMHKGKKKGEVLELYKTPLSKIPIRRIDYKNPKDKNILNMISDKVDKIISIKKELVKYNEYFIGERLTSYEAGQLLVDIDIAKVIESFQKNRLNSLRLHPDIQIEKDKNIDTNKFYIKNIGEIEQTLFRKKPNITLRAKNKLSIILISDRNVLKTISILLKKYKNKTWNEVENALLLPLDIDELEEKINEIKRTISNHIKDINIIQKDIDRIVYKLYNLTIEEINLIEHGLQ